MAEKRRGGGARRSPAKKSTGTYGQQTRAGKRTGMTASQKKNLDARSSTKGLSKSTPTKSKATKPKTKPGFYEAGTRDKKDYSKDTRPVRGKTVTKAAPTKKAAPAKKAAPKSKFGVGTSKTVQHKGRSMANVTKEQLQKSGYKSLTAYMNAWNKQGKRPTKK